MECGRTKSFFKLQIYFSMEDRFLKICQIYFDLENISLHIKALSQAHKLRVF